MLWLRSSPLSGKRFARGCEINLAIVLFVTTEIMKKQTDPLLLQVLFIFSLVLPWLIFLLLPGRTVVSLFFFWIAMMLCLFAIWIMAAARGRREAAG